MKECPKCKCRFDLPGIVSCLNGCEGRLVEVTSPVTQAKINEWARGADVLCLHAICQPVANEMQAAIRFQRRQLDRIARDLDYVFARMRNDAVFRGQFEATECFARLTAAAAEAKGVDVNTLRNSIIPGSARMHRPRDEDDES